MQPGIMLAHYRVEEKIGAGGMGEVYRAQDTTLGRDVALKLLPPEFASDADRSARFQREAKMLASLHHPNIASIFGYETTEEATFLVMELIDGEDLSESIKRGPIPAEEAIDIARQIAEGLEEAHEKGIIHRDLKPANVKRTPDGKVKVLDFGLARAFSGETATEGSISSAPTMTAAMTQAGTVLGTAAYMSPEQARGKDVDRRTDIWAFGVILFEMLTGKQLFAGETASDTLAGILKTEPDWSELPAGLPLQVERVIRRCLSKEPRQRLRDIGEARVRLEDPEAESGVFSGPIAVAEESTGSKSGRLSWLPWSLVAVGVLAVIWLMATGGGAPEQRTLKLAVPTPEGIVFALSGASPGLPVISPDGRRIVYSGRSLDDASVQLYVRSLETGHEVPISGSTNAQYPFWSPDSRSLGFFSQSEGVQLVLVDGGAPLSVAVATNGKGGTWNGAGQVIFAPDYNTSLQIVPETGGDATDITDVAADEGFDSHRHPQFMPDGRHFIYLARGRGGKDSELRFASLDGGETKVIMSVDTGVIYASGHLLFLRGNTLMAIPFDPEKGATSGQPQAVAQDVLVITGAAKGAVSASDDGTLVILRGEANSEARLAWIDREGRELTEQGDKATYDTVKLSPDGRQAAVTVLDAAAGTLDIWILDIERDFLSRLTTTPATDMYPVWSPDGRHVYFSSDQDGPFAIYRQEIGGPGAAELVLKPEGESFIWDISPDGQTILFSTINDSSGTYDLWTADLDGQKEQRPLRRSGGNDGAARFSPDGRWITFWSTESGNGQVYLAPWPAMAPISQVSTATGTWVFWHGDSNALVYLEEGGTLTAVDLIETEGRVRLSPPQPLFDHAAAQLEGSWLDMTADGERFLSISSASANPPGYCDVILNWPGMIDRP